MKEGLDQIEELADLLDYDHQHHDQRGDAGHERLFVPAGTLEQDVQHGDKDTDRGDFENQFNVHRLCYSSAIQSMAADSSATQQHVRLFCL